MTGIWLISYVVLWIMFFATAVALITTMRTVEKLNRSISSMGGHQQTIAEVKVGQQLPDITLRNLQGSDVTISHMFNVNAVVWFVSPTCGPCQLLVRDLDENDILSELKMDKILISHSDIESAKDWISQSSLAEDVVVLVDERHYIIEKWGILSTPTTLFINDDMEVTRYIPGYSDNLRLNLLA